MLINKRIGEFHNINIAGKYVGGTLIKNTKLGILINQIKKIFNTSLLSENSISIYRDNDTNHIIHKKIIITESLSKNEQYDSYHIAHTRLAEAISASEYAYRNVF